MTLPGAFLSSRRKKWWHHTWLAWAYFNHIMRSCKPCYFACFFVCTPSKKRYSSYTGCAKPSQAITTCKVSRQQPLARDTKKEKQHRCRACGISASFQGRMFSLLVHTLLYPLCPCYLCSAFLCRQMRGLAYSAKTYSNHRIWFPCTIILSTYNDIIAIVK